MASFECVVGKDPITEVNDSEEHIILNAAGGVQTTRGFICTKHNNKTGSDWDAELASQLNGLCHIFGIKRVRGETPDQTVETTAGETFVMLRDGSFALPKPTLEKKQVGAQTRIQIKARDTSEARKILRGLKRKHPNLDVEAELAKAQSEMAFPAGMINIPIQIGGVRAGRSIVKSAAAFAHDCGIPVTVCEQALAYLCDENAPACFGYYQSSDLVVGRPRSVPLHCVAIEGDPDTGLLLGYVEYFGFLRMVVCLSKSYTGVRINRCHAIDPTGGKELAFSVRMKFTLADIADIFEYKYCHQNDTVRSLGEVLGPAMERKNTRERGRITAEAVRFAFENCGAKEGEVITPEHAGKLARLMAEKLTPYILNLNRPRPAPPGATFYPYKSNSRDS